ncbi:hypothetical protein Tco_1120889 [Tanacetum coccineum]|uniref:Uncharacterized protein n=1 Tax=Tanacetum coccineum TaxID=301880 RepID=A0ABQ5IWB9_9ASTR
MVRSDVDRCVTIGLKQTVAGNLMVGQNVGNGSSFKGGIQRRNDIYRAVIEVSRHELMKFDRVRIRLKRLGLLLGLHIRGCLDVPS